MIRVSVVVPAYNAARFIADTLESVFAQTFTGYEVIVVNDGSPDTPEFERELAPYMDRIVYLTQRNTGPSGARNRAIRAARGELVAFLDSDDQWLPDFLAEQVRTLDEDPRIDLLYSDGVIFGDSELAGRTLMQGSPSTGEVTFERLVREECTVLTTCTVARRDAIMAAGLFDGRFVRSEDFHLWLRLAFRGAHLAYTRRVLVRHRRRRQGSLASDRLPMLDAFVAVLRDIAETLPLSAAQRALVDHQIARRRADIALEEGKRCFLAGQYDKAEAALARARAAAPGPAQRGRLAALQAAVRLSPRMLRRAYEVLRGPAAVPPVERAS